MAAEPTERNSGIVPILPFGDINLIVLTDIHSWVGGHGDNEGPNNLDVSYGDVVSFYERLKEHCSHVTNERGGTSGADESNETGDDECGDLWLVQNGDWIDGTGLATDGDPSSLIPLLQKVPFDVLNTGNHELYRDSVIKEMRKPGGFLQWWGHRHLASNVYMHDASNGAVSSSLGDRLEPMSNRYHILKGKSSTILVFGFIYDLPNPSDLVVVQTVEEAVKEVWFRNALTDRTIGYDAILVMLHAGHDDPSVEILRSAIRKGTKDAGIDEDGDLPIQFIAGHTHYRRYAVADPQSTVVEAGRYMDTVGWVSFPNAKTIRNEKEKRRLSNASSYGNFTDIDSSMGSSTLTSNATAPTNASVTDLFHHVFLDADVATLREALGLSSSAASPNNGNDDGDDFQTPLGIEVSEFIRETQESMGLLRKIGCAPRDYPLNVSMGHEDSVWRLYRDEVAPHALATAELVGDKNEDAATPVASMTTVASNNRVLFMSQDSWRYGLYGGNHLNYDDILVVSPFNEPIYRVSVLPCSSILLLNQSMNADATEIDRFYNTLPAWIPSWSENLDADGVDTVSNCELYVNHFGLSRVQTGIETMVSSRAETIPWNPVESNLTTTSIWFSFVEDRWQCSGYDGQDDGIMTTPGDNHNTLGNWWGPNPSTSDDKTSATLYGKRSVILVIIAFSIAFLFALAIKRPCIIRKRRRGNGQSEYDGIITNSSCNTNADGDSPSTLHEGQFCDEEPDEVFDDSESNERFSEQGAGIANKGETSI